MSVLVVRSMWFWSRGLTSFGAWGTRYVPILEFTWKPAWVGVEEVRDVSLSSPFAPVKRGGASMDGLQETITLRMGAWVPCP